MCRVYPPKSRCPGCRVGMLWVSHLGSAWGYAGGADQDCGVLDDAFGLCVVAPLVYALSKGWTCGFLLALFVLLSLFAASTGCYCR